MIHPVDPAIKSSKAPGNQQEQTHSIAVPPIHVHGPARPAQGPKVCLLSRCWVFFGAGDESA